MGLREQKKQQTRTALADAALGLFVEHGFDGVTVADVARATGVSVNTVFNYFPVKEDLFFDRQEEVEAELADLVRDRPAGIGAAEALRDGLLAAMARRDATLGLNPAAWEFWNVVAASPALLGRAREIAERTEERLALALAGERVAGQRDSDQRDSDQRGSRPTDAPARVDVIGTPDSVDVTDTVGAPARVLAGALAGTYRALVSEIRRRVAAGDPVTEVENAVATTARKAFGELTALETRLMPALQSAPPPESRAEPGHAPRVPSRGAADSAQPGSARRADPGG